MQSIQKVQKAIYEIINSQITGELANINGVFHYIPQETNFPYIHLDNGKVEEISDFKNDMFKVSIKINVFDKSKSNSITMNLCEEIRTLLIDINNLNIENYNILDSKHKSCEISMENNREIWKGEMEFEIIVKKN